MKHVLQQALILFFSPQNLKSTLLHIFANIESLNMSVFIQTSLKKKVCTKQGPVYRYAICDYYPCSSVKRKFIAVY